MQPENTSAITNVEHSTFRYFFTHPLYVLASLLDILAAGIFIRYFGVAGLVVLFYFFIPILFLFEHAAAKVRVSYMKQFADSIGYSFSPTSDIASVEGELFNIGDNRKLSDVASGTNRGRPTRIFFYQYSTGGGKSRQTNGNTVFETTLSNLAPHILVKHGSTILDEIGFGIGLEHLSFEGDFDKHFGVWVEKGFETEAYEIFTPDFMTELIDKAKLFDFEFSKNKLYIYENVFVDRRSDLNAMFVLSDTLVSQLAPTIEGMDADVSDLSEEIEKY